MNLLDKILGVLRFEFFKQASTAPAWRGVGSRMRKSRMPYQGRAPRETPGFSMKLEKFLDKEKRDERFAELRSSGARHVSKFSDVEGGRSIWCVVRQ